MVINEKMLQEDLYEIMLKQVKEDLRDGLFDDHLLTLWNMSSTFQQLHFSEKELMDLWVKYRVYCEIQKLYANKPEMFGGFTEIKGEENMNEVLSVGGIFLTFHYGHDRSIPVTIADKLMGTDKSLYRVIDQNGLEDDRKAIGWKHLYQKNSIEEVVCSNLNQDAKLQQIISKGDSSLFYLDGTLGFDDQYETMDANFMFSKVTIPTSIFRLAVRFHKPVCFLISTQNEQGEAVLIAKEPIWIHDNDIKEKAQLIYQMFEKEFLINPELWRKWDQPFDEVKSQRIKKFDMKLDVVNRWRTRGFNFQSGQFYEIAHT